MKQVGLRWYKCDFHLHTMCSKCYQEQMDTPEMWVDAVKKAEIDCIAITDHNDYRGINDIKTLCEKEGIIAFPGVELSCSDSKIHMLVLFDTNCDETDVQEFLNSVDITKEKYGESGKTCSGTLSEVCEKAKKKNALVIAAHIDEFSGINEMSHENMVSLLDRKYISAVQIVNKEIWDKYGSDYENAAIELSKKYGKEISKDVAQKWKKAYNLALESGIPMLSFSDNPAEQGSAKHGLWGIGSSYTWMKMDQAPNLESVRQTLLSSDMRVKTIVDTAQKPDIEPELWIKSIKANNTLLNSEDFEVLFNPQLNCIIGGRGSGKSSIVRILAGGLQAFDADNLEKIKEEQNNFYKIPSKDKKGIFNKDSQIEIILERAQVLYKIEITKIKNMQEQQRALYKYENGVWQLIDDINYFDFFEAQIYTQKQIYELALDSTSLLNIIDEDIKDVSKKIDEKETLLSQIISKRTEIWNLEKAIQEKGKIETELKDVEEQISKFEKSGISDALKEKQKYDNQQNLLDEYIRNRENLLNVLTGKIQECFLDFEVDTLGNDEIDVLLQSDLVYLREREEEILAICDLIKASGIQLSTQLEQSQWQKDRISANTKYSGLSQSLMDQGLDFSKLNSLLDRKKTKNDELKKIAEYEIQVLSEEKNLVQLEHMYLEVSDEITSLRSDFIKDVIGINTNVKFTIKRRRNRNSFVQTIKLLINKNQNSLDEDIEKLADVYFSKSDGVEFKQQLEEIRKGEGKKNYSLKFRKIIIEMPPESYARMISFLPEDDLEVSYKPEGHKKYIPLSNASAGQKTTAILTFLLAHGTVPLLLDQPEDDLDNKLVYDLIVSRLKTAKSQRQIIVVTHNANIPVNADAEYIISMNSETDNISIKHKGTMDDEIIRKEICDVMEGTKFAFEMRAKKYHFRIIE